MKNLWCHPERRHLGLLSSSPVRHAQGRLRRGSIHLVFALFLAFFFVACGDDDSSFATRPSDGSSSSVCEDCDDGSSSSAKSSSSSAESSSSVTLATPCKTDSTDTCEYGELVDDRDGQTYKTVKIGDKWWMAENLNYEVDSSFCYNDSAEYCEKFGRLYRWAATVGKSESECGYGYTCSLPSGDLQGVCPSGWHLPSRAEWETLINAVGGKSTAGIKLKSSSGWNSSGNGTDAFGFTALPAGDRNVRGEFSLEGRDAFFWSSTENDCSYADCMLLRFGYDDGGMRLRYDDALLDDFSKYFVFSVRCLKD
ncbi:major paralogous domain-containing protein [Fibrobacter sp. UWT3]|uniref:fibrobacter succinogenes major paralogous domain-containing protein n=1 Tax=Fibrobacter sp. UWT3 TaxID=1896225 RepID=UPI000BDCD39D|nr:fibrobacter succinogenes major paralogous domain-containing protein [Fibrobacter sp. UWT3]SOE78557.1 major paralogous domain-containing protein [Fibrobacter sp. UWT3]